jgi:hypothetical protein
MKTAFRFDGRMPGHSAGEDAPILPPGGPCAAAGRRVGAAAAFDAFDVFGRARPGVEARAVLG